MKTVKTVVVTVHMAGPIEIAKNRLRQECYENGLCVTISPETFIYTGGEEEGFRIGFVNYPRFPSNVRSLQLRAIRVAKDLVRACCQRTALVVGPTITTWIVVDPPGMT